MAKHSTLIATTFSWVPLNCSPRPAQRSTNPINFIHILNYRKQPDTHDTVMGGSPEALGFSRHNLRKFSRMFVARDRPPGVQ